MKTAALLLISLAILSACGAPARRVSPGPGHGSSAVPAKGVLGRGVNLGNALEAPNEGEWGVVLDEGYFRLIAGAGFDTVRIPARFSGHALVGPPYTIDSAFLERVEWAAGAALGNGLNAILDLHHYLEIFESPRDHVARFVAIWRQIAEHFRDWPDTLYFELLNEPNTNLTSKIWNDLLVRTLAAVRESNPHRWVIVGPAAWNGIDRLPELVLPSDDRNLIVTVHYYLPFPFTHQGAEWVSGSGAWLGTRWLGTTGERMAIQQDLGRAAQWAERENRPLFLGEFGAYSRADTESRSRWTASVARTAEELGMSWAYWEFCAGFGVYDPVGRSWRRPLLGALIPEAP